LGKEFKMSEKNDPIILVYVEDNTARFAKLKMNASSAKKEIRKVTAFTGHEIEIDVSDGACAKFCCGPGNIIITPENKVAFVLGVAPSFYYDPDITGIDELWYTLKGDPERRAHFSPNSMARGGFRIMIPPWL
jgi:hypothetical protein